MITPTTTTPLADDGLPEDRVKCGSCFHRSANYCRALRMLTWGDLPVSCLRYIPLTTESDQRTGAERWPWLEQEIKDIRAIEARGKVTT